MMKYLVLILAAPVASAFVLQPPVVLVRPTFALHKSRDSFDAASAADVDMARAKECAEKFGICSVKEVEDLRDSVHDARVRNMFLSNVGGGAPVHNEDTLIEQRLLEDDLSLQLKLLHEETPEKMLFPEKALMAEEVTMHPEHFQPKASASATAQALTLLDENMLESMVICVIFGVLVMAPHLLKV